MILWKFTNMIIFSNEYKRKGKKGEHPMFKIVINPTQKHECIIGVNSNDKNPEKRTKANIHVQGDLMLEFSTSYF